MSRRCGLTWWRLVRRSRCLLACTRPAWAWTWMAEATGEGPPATTAAQEARLALCTLLLAAVGRHRSCDVTLTLHVDRNRFVLPPLLTLVQLRVAHERPGFVGGGRCGCEHCCHRPASRASPTSPLRCPARHDPRWCTTATQRRRNRISTRSARHPGVFRGSSGCWHARRVSGGACQCCNAASGFHAARCGGCSAVTNQCHTHVRRRCRRLAVASSCVTAGTAACVTRSM